MIRASVQPSSVSPLLMRRRTGSQAGVARFCRAVGRIVAGEAYPTLVCNDAALALTPNRRLIFCGSQIARHVDGYRDGLFSPYCRLPDAGLQ